MLRREEERRGAKICIGAGSSGTEGGSQKKMEREGEKCGRTTFRDMQRWERVGEQNFTQERLHRWEEGLKDPRRCRGVSRLQRPSGVGELDFISSLKEVGAFSI